MAPPADQVVEMTLLPSSDFGITGWPGNAYAVNEICAHPTCGARSAHAHHCWRRSFIRKDYEWVRLPDGTIIGNRIGLCVDHHDQVTGEVGGYRARLAWDGGLLWWEDKVPGVGPASNDTWDRVAPIDPQPPLAPSLTTDLGSVVASKYVVASDNAVAHGHVLKSERDVCPTCGHHKPNPDEPKAKLERRNTKQWVVSVPDDAENGADLLDTIIEDLAIPIGATEWSSRLKRYYVLVLALNWVQQNRSEFIADLAEAAERRVAAG